MSAEEQSTSVIITGASRGIGRTIATAFARQTRHSLLLIARTESELKETKWLCEEEAGAGEVVYIACDATDEEAVRNLSIPSGFPEPQFLINNAGSYLLKTLADTSMDELKGQVESNLYSAVNITRRFLSYLMKHKKSLIVNISSVGALEGLGDSGAYSASKHALLGYTRSLRKELIETSVGVTAINLGQTQSTSWEGSSMDRNRLIDPKDVANLIIALTRFSPRTVAEEIILKPKHGRVSSM